MVLLHALLEKAKQLYDEGHYQEAVNLMDSGADDLETAEDALELCRLMAWCYYYLAIKGDKGEIPEIAAKMKKTRAGTSIMYGRDAIKGGRFKGTVLSAFNVLPLAEWIMGHKRVAWCYSDEAIRKFEYESSAWNTRGILMRWAGKFEESLEVFDMVTQTALMVLDFRTAGHGQQNKGDSLVKLGRFVEAREAYEDALKLYRQFEFRGGKAPVHIESVQKKIAGLPA